VPLASLKNGKKIIGKSVLETLSQDDFSSMLNDIADAVEETEEELALA